MVDAVIPKGSWSGVGGGGGGDTAAIGPFAACSSWSAMSVPAPSTPDHVHEVLERRGILGDVRIGGRGDVDGRPLHNRRLSRWTSNQLYRHVLFINQRRVRSASMTKQLVLHLYVNVQTAFTFI